MRSSTRSTILRMRREGSRGEGRRASCCFWARGDLLLADRVVAARIVVGRVLLARDQLLRVVELAVGARADLIDDRRLEVDEDRARHVLARARLREEGVEGIVATADGLVRRHLAVRLDAVLEAVQLPAGVAA